MTLPMGEALVRALLARLQLIRPVEGYHTAAGENAARHRNVWSDGELPAIGLYDGGTDAAPGTADGRTASMTLTKVLQVVGFAPAGQLETGEVLALLEADIKRNVLTWVTSGALKEELSARIGRLAYVRTEPLAREESSNCEGVLVTFTATYQEGYGEPDGPL